MVVYFLRLAYILVLFARIASVLLIFLFLLPILVQWKPALTQYTYFSQLLAFEQLISSPLNDIVAAFGAKQLTPLLLNVIKIIIMLIISSNLKHVGWRIKYQADRLNTRREIANWKGSKTIAVQNTVYEELESKLELLSTIKDKDASEKLYAEILQLKRKLETLSRYFAFLSIDVVDSTGMKNSEDRSLIQLDTLRFKKLIQGILDKNGCVKSAWTPDGTMACFNTVDNAISAAQESLRQLVNFNKNVKAIQRDFLVRCGIHAGVIYYDEHFPLEEISDQVIDIAGHMQKHAKPGAIAISKPSFKPVDEVMGFKKVEKQVDNLDVYEWTQEA